MNNICNRCVMDDTVIDIKFDKNGICNFCKEAEKKLEIIIRKKNDNYFHKVINEAKKDNNKQFDCIFGISGGLDSSYLLHILIENGIRPYVVHLDNGWNTDLAVKNIHNLLDKLNLDLQKTHVINWKEFKSLQRSFLKSGLANFEIPTDHAIFSLLFNLADELNIKYIFHGGNKISESIMPSSWMESFLDQKLIFSINKLFENTSLESYPTQDYFTLFKRVFFKKIKYISLLDYIDYDLNKAKSLLNTKYQWESYKYKHGESFITSFFQEYLLPKKFNIDKRKAHYSSLIISDQLKRSDALQLLKDKPLLKDLENKIDFVCSKLEFEKDEFIKLLNLPRKYLKGYPNYQSYVEKFNYPIKLIKKIVT